VQDAISWRPPVEPAPVARRRHFCTEPFVTPPRLTFKTQLKQVALGGAAVEYSTPSRQLPPIKLPEVVLDPSWLRGTRFPKPSLKPGKKNKS
jgi:hypothetical protein